MQHTISRHCDAGSQETEKWPPVTCAGHACQDTHKGQDNICTCFPGKPVKEGELVAAEKICLRSFMTESMDKQAVLEDNREDSLFFLSCLSNAEVYRHGDSPFLLSSVRFLDNEHTDCWLLSK